ncbi:MAG: hypothetical protein ACK2T3_00195 [Candidatus Promineifilaceae bacterium]
MAMIPGMEASKPRRAVMKWLLYSDPSIRWQVMRDLTGESESSVSVERVRVSKEGWGAKLLESQAPDGTWWSDSDPWPLKGTIFMLVLLKDLGLDPACEGSQKALDRVRENVTWLPLGCRPFFDGETEPCINGRILATGAYFGEASDSLVDRLLSEQLEDGGWNCEAENGSTRSSFHSTICVLEGLLEYERANGDNKTVAAARIRAQEYLLARRMFRSRSTGEVIDRKWTRFSFPSTHYYDVLRGLDYLRSASVEPDERVDEAVAIVIERQHQNGRWPLDVQHPDLPPFDMGESKGRASRWITLRALRVLAWYGVYDDS